MKLSMLLKNVLLVLSNLLSLLYNLILKKTAVEYEKIFTECYRFG